MLRNVFTINLNHKLVCGKACVGKLDGKNNCIVTVIASDKILIHNPYTKFGKNGSSSSININTISSELNILNINQKINSIACGRLIPNQEQDVLIVGTPNSILVFDVLNNADVFYKEITDGANTVLISEVGSIKKPLALVGGNGALQGFDHEGSDSYWTVTGDNVTTMCACDFNQDGLNELVVGSEGNEIRIFKEDAIMFDIQETDSLKCVCYLSPQCFAYALANGTVGVYLKKERLWRIKSKNEVVSLVAFDVNGDGQMELVTGWSSGKLDARDVQTDYDQDGKIELLILCSNGEVKAFQSVQNEDFMLVSIEETVKTEQQQRLTQLLRRKQQLALELRSFESSGLYAEEQKYASEEELRSRARPTALDEQYGAIPADTQLKSALLLHLGDDFNKGSVHLCLQATNETIIRTAAVFAEGIFKGESFLVHPSESDLNSSLVIPLRPLKNLALDLHIKALVGYSGSYHFHVFELTRHLPRFSMFAILSENDTAICEPSGSAVYKLSEKVPKLIWWINRNFLISEEVRASDSGYLCINMRCLRTGAAVRIELQESNAQLQISGPNMALVGELLQSFAQDCLQGQSIIQSLNCEASFPEEMAELRSLVNEVEQLQIARQQLTADLADSSSYVKALVVKVEDARLLQEYSLMRKRFIELHQLNKELISGYRVRNQNQQALIDNLKKINGIIQVAANLRIGSSKMQLIKSCRLAIRQNNLNILSRIITTGEN